MPRVPSHDAGLARILAAAIGYVAVRSPDLALAVFSRPADLWGRGWP